MPPEAILFDLDGTLVDSVADIHAAANQMLAEHGLPGLDLPTVKSFVGNGVHALVQRCLRRVEATVDIEKAVACFQRVYHEQGHRLTALYDGVADTLADLASDYRLAICTNKPLAPTRIILETLDIARHFTAIIGGDSVGALKPDPRPLLAAAKGCGAEIAKCRYVGDTEVDAEACRRAGVPFLLFTEGYRKSPVEMLNAESSFADFRVLPDLIRALI